MADVLHFYHHPWTRGGTIHWLLEELGVPYEVTLLNLKKNEQKDPKYLAINPMGKIPAIVHNGVVVTEVAAICVYLADAFPAAKLSPRLDDSKRGTFLRWIFFASGCTEPALIDKLFARPPADPKAVGYGTYEEAFDNLENALKPGPFVLGETFSAADVFIASQLGWGISAKGIEPRPIFENYLKRCKERPAHQRFTQQGQEMLKKLSQD